MSIYKLGEIETKFADLIWNNQPLPSGELVKLAQTELDWKKSTTYTILRKLCEKGIFQNTDGIVSALISKSEYSSLQSEMFIEENFEGSLPNFLSAFSKRKKLTDSEIEEILTLINQHRR